MASAQIAQFSLTASNALIRPVLPAMMDIIFRMVSVKPVVIL